MLKHTDLPDDKDRLKRLALDLSWENEHLKLQLAQYRRWTHGSSAESLDRAGQLALTLGELHAAAREAAGVLEMPKKASVEKLQPKRQPLPTQFPRFDQPHPPKECVCPDCGGELSELGKPAVSEVLEVKTVTFTVTRHIRPKKRCQKCSTIVQAPAPARPLPRSYAGASLLALVLVWKYGFHLPLYRQCQIFAQAGLNVSRTTLMQWVAGSTALMQLLAQACGRYVRSAPNIHADDTPIKELAPGRGKTKTSYLWTYVRDGRAWGSRDPPAAWYQYSPGRSGKYPMSHLKDFAGKLQVDAYAGFDRLFVPKVPCARATKLEIACWAHARRKLFDLYDATKSSTAEEALLRIQKLYEIEDEIRGQAPETRHAVRQARAVPLLGELKAWMMSTVAQVDKGSALAKAFNYSLNNWVALLRYTEDGRLEIDNNTGERSIRGIGVGRKNFLFLGSSAGGERAAIAYTLIESCKLNGIDPQRYLEYVLTHIGNYPVNRIDELLPWNVADKLGNSQLSQLQDIARAA